MAAETRLVTVYEDNTYHSVTDVLTSNDPVFDNPEWTRIKKVRLGGFGEGIARHSSGSIFDEVGRLLYSTSLGRSLPSTSIKSYSGGNGGGPIGALKKDQSTQKSELTNGKIGKIVAEGAAGFGTINHNTSDFPLALKIKDIITIGWPFTVSLPISYPILLISATAIIPSDTPIDRPQELDLPDNGWNWHHIATDKYLESEPYWTPRFEELFNEVGLKLNDPFNIVPVFGHKGPHPQEYHKEVFSRLFNNLQLTKSLTLSSRQTQFRIMLMQLSTECVTPGFKLNSLLIR
jgi:hypothetical protein